MAGVKKHQTEKMPERDTLSYLDHMKKLHEKGEATKEDLIVVGKLKNRVHSVYDL